MLHGMLERLVETGRCYGKEINAEKTEVMRNSRQPFRIQIVIDQKQPENVDCYKHFGSMVTNDAKCTREIKPSISVAKAAFKRNLIIFTSKLDLNLRKKSLDRYIWNTVLYSFEGK